MPLALIDTAKGQGHCPILYDRMRDAAQGRIQTAKEYAMILREAVVRESRVVSQFDSGKLGLSR